MEHRHNRHHPVVARNPITSKKFDAMALKQTGAVGIEPTFGPARGAGCVAKARGGVLVELRPACDGPGPHPSMFHSNAARHARGISAFGIAVASHSTTTAAQVSSLGATAAMTGRNCGSQKITASPA